MEFTANVGAMDQKIRLGAGVALLLVALLGLTGTAALVVGIVGVVALATGFMKFCPAYRLLGMNTCSTS